MFLPDWQPITVDLPTEWEFAHLYFVHDLHYGSELFDARKWMRLKDRIISDKYGKVLFIGDLFENALKDIKRALDMYPGEFMLLDIREYYPQKFGPITLTYKADKNKVDALLEKYIQPEKYAFCDFEHISQVTVGDIRRSGKRYILIHENAAYKFSKNCEQILPWEKQVNGAKAEKFANETLRFFDDYNTDGLYWFQTQQTPNLGTEIGVTTPAKLDEDLVKHFDTIINGIANTPRYLERANIIAGDFMTRNYAKTKAILELNLRKGNVKPELEKAYEQGLV